MSCYTSEITGLFLFKEKWLLYWIHILYKIQILKILKRWDELVPKTLIKYQALFKVWDSRTTEFLPSWGL